RSPTPTSPSHAFGVGPSLSPLKGGEGLKEDGHMKIASLETGIVLLPNDEPLAGFSENPNAKNPIVWLKLRTDDGIEGLGVTYFGGALTRTLRHAVDELGALVIGDDPLRVEAVAR